MQSVSHRHPIHRGTAYRVWHSSSFSFTRGPEVAQCRSWPPALRVPTVAAFFFLFFVICPRGEYSLNCQVCTDENSRPSPAQPQTRTQACRMVPHTPLGQPAMPRHRELTGTRTRLTSARAHARCHGHCDATSAHAHAAAAAAAAATDSGHAGGGGGGTGTETARLAAKAAAS